MRRLHSVFAFICVAALGCATTSTVPEEPRQEPAKGDGEAKPGGGGGAADEAMAAEMAKWAEAGMVGEHHKHLAMLEGKWKAVSQHWMAPGAPPSSSKGTATNTLILGGRFLRFEYQGNIQMGEQSIPFTGLGFLGYDNIDRWHTAIWMDSMSTSFMFQQGTCDEDGRNITINGSFADPTKPERTPVRTVYRVEGKDRYVMEMYMPDKDGNEFKSMEIVHTRAG